MAVFAKEERLLLVKPASCALCNFEHVVGVSVHFTYNVISQPGRTAGAFVMYGNFRAQLMKHLIAGILALDAACFIAQ